MNSQRVFDAQASLGSLAAETGGQAFFLESVSELEAIYAAIQEASDRAGSGILQRLALAISLEHAVPVSQRNPEARPDAPADRKIEHRQQEQHPQGADALAPRHQEAEAIGDLGGAAGEAHVHHGQGEGRLGQLGVELLPPPAVPHGHRHGALGPVLADDVPVEPGDDLAGGQVLHGI